MADLRKKGAAPDRSRPGADGGLEARRDVQIPFTVRWSRQTPTRQSTSRARPCGSTRAPGASGCRSSSASTSWCGSTAWRSSTWCARTASCSSTCRPSTGGPTRRWMPISSPSALSKQLYERLGTYRTLGWAEATWPLNEDRIDEKAFLDDLFRAFDDRSQVILHEIDSKKFDLVYRRAGVDRPGRPRLLALARPDAPVVQRGRRREVRRRDRTRLPADGPNRGRVRERIAGHARLRLSDHGFHTFKSA